MQRWDDFQLHLTIDDILRGQGADPAIIRRRRPSLLEPAAFALEQGLARVKPVALAQESRLEARRRDRLILAGGNELTGPLVTHHFAGAESLVAVVCTIGPHLEAFAASQPDPLRLLALDGLGNAAAEQLAQQVCARLAGEARDRHLQAGTPLSPGEPGWPVDPGQSQIFALVDPAVIGIQLTPAGMMIPKKSISFVVGLGRQVSQVHLCDLCSLKETCRYRSK